MNSSQIKDYVVQHDLQGELKQAVNALIQAQPLPTQPLAFLANYLKSAGRSRANSGSSPVSTGDGDDEHDEARYEALANALMAAAVEAEPMVTPLLQQLADECGGSLPGLESKFKGKKSLLSKIARDHKEEVMRALEKDLDTSAVDVAAIVWGTSDALRYTMIVPTERYTPAVKKAMQTFDERGMFAVKLKNYWPGGDTYQGINDVFALRCAASPNGQIRFELQFHTPESFKVKMESHHYYELRRTTNDPVAKMQSYKDEAAVAATVPVPEDVLSIPHTKSRPLPGEAELYAALALTRAMGAKEGIVAAACAAMAGVGVGGEAVSSELLGPSEVEAELKRSVDDPDEEEGAEDREDHCELREACARLAGALVVRVTLPEEGYSQQAAKAMAALRKEFRPCKHNRARNGWATPGKATPSVAGPANAQGLWLPLVAPGEDDGVAFTNDDEIPFTVALHTPASLAAAEKLIAIKWDVFGAVRARTRKNCCLKALAVRAGVTVPEGALDIAVDPE